ncbi:mediator complex, subunit Med16 [Bombardia bombarda]|uniref:Mediator of RNA polymerase II transcription subunit 16 n=1 Tax=Bombardia bombarda TaxID=252184 RepID=A0AA39WNA3_9PEZI|nr:mediator complex, subunit Med16 [Bombardia bombarda]
MHVMDGDMALDEVDLFGDPVMDDTLTLTSRPAPAKQLQRRLDELRTRGCYQGIAWSRQGTIASISKDGQTIELRFLRCRPHDASWGLSEPYSLPPPNALSPPAGIITHLAWAATSSPELAVIDSVGRISILSFGITLNRAYNLRKWDADPVDDLHAVVGCYWLPLRMSNRQFNYQTNTYPAFGPWHPNHGKSALLCVTTNGLLKLIFSQNNNRVEETALELESVTSSDDSITHASLCSDIKDTLLIAFATTSKQLRVVRASIQWGLPQNAADKQAPPGSIHLTPVLRERHVAVSSWVGPSESTLDASMAQLSHIEVLPSVPRTSPVAIAAPAAVLTVRSYLPSDTSPYGQESQSILDRWEIVSDQEQAVHPAFEQLGPKNSATSPPTMTRLRKLEPIILPKIIVSIHTMQLGRVLCFAFSDGTVQYRDRFTMNEIYNEQDLNAVTSLHQIGFQFVDETPCLQVAFSPTNCSFVQICEDGEIRWNSLHYVMDDPNTALQDSRRYSAILAALSVAMSTVAIYQTNGDDLLAIGRLFVQNQGLDFAYAWIREMVNMLKTPVDYSEERYHDQLVRNHHLQLNLSILNHLGFRGEFKPRTFGGKFAFLALNVRNIVILITIATAAPPITSLGSHKEKLNPLDEPEVVDALAGCVKWAVDLLSWMTDCLLQLADDPAFMSILSDPKRFTELAAFLRARGDPSLYFLLASSTRGLLYAACRRLGHLEVVSTRASNHISEVKAHTPKDGDSTTASTLRPPSALYHAYQKMERYISSSLIKVSEFETLLKSLSQEIRKNYQVNLPNIPALHKTQMPGTGQGQTGGPNAQEKIIRRCELDILLASNPPPIFREVLLKFFTSSLPAFRSQTDPAGLYFSNFDLLEVEDEEASLAAKKAAGKRVDVFKRIELYANGRDVTTAAAGTGGISTTVAAFKNGSPRGGGQTAAGHGGGGNDASGPLWRRCVRCAAVMEDVTVQKPGFTFVVAQQRKCACGGNWSLLPKSSINL